MFKINSSLFTLIVVHITLPSSIRLTAKDYAGYKYSSNYSRSPLTASRVLFPWIDIFNEFEDMESKYVTDVDLGSGYPDYMPPQHLLDAMVTVAKNTTTPEAYKIHQYERVRGNEQLVRIVAKFYSLLLKRDLNPYKEVLITTGASHALNLAARAFVNPGEEVILFEPFYPGYDHYIRLAGGVPVYVPLIANMSRSVKDSNDLTYDKNVLESKFNDRTKMIWVNNPNNPTGKTFTLDELEFIGALAHKYDVIIVADEVGQWYYYDGQPVIRFASLKEHWKRTISVVSGGKTFSNTGWRVGWAIAPEPLLWAMSAMTDSSVISVSTPIQIAFAIGLEEELKRWDTPESYFIANKRFATGARNKVMRIFESIGARVVLPNAGYFIVANFTDIVHQLDLSSEKDDRPGMRLRNALIKQLGVSAYPLTIFYSPRNAWTAEYVLRFTFIKSDRIIKEFDQRIHSVFKSIHK